MALLEDVSVGYFLEDGFEDLEFFVPKMRLIEEGADVTVIDTGRRDEYEGKRGLTAVPDQTAEKVQPHYFEAVVIPGGWAPDKLRRDEHVLQLVTHCYESPGKIVGSICHAGWVPVSAGLVEGHDVTGSTGIRDDVENAGGRWVDEPAFRDGPFVFGRVVKDIPDFCRELVAALRAEK